MVDVPQAAKDAAAKVSPSIVGFGGATGYGHLCEAFALFEQQVRLTAEQAKTAEIAKRVERAIELRRYLFGGEPLNANERNIVEGIRTAVLDALLNKGDASHG